MTAPTATEREDARHSERRILFVHSVEPFPIRDGVTVAAGGCCVQCFL